MKDPELVVRKYKDEDKENVREICWNTAFSGKSGDLFFDDKELLVDFCCDYYTHYEKGSTFVAEVGKKIVGYLFGCKNTKGYNKIISMKIAPRIIGNILMFRYKMGRKTLQFFFTVVKDSIRYGLPKRPYEEYPAHLHINVQEEWRGYGIGKKLMNKYFEYLVNNSISKIHLVTNSYNENSVAFFCEQGFHSYSKTKTSCLKSLTNKQVYFVTLVKKLK